MKREEEGQGEKHKDRKEGKRSKKFNIERYEEKTKMCMQRVKENSEMGYLRLG